MPRSVTRALVQCDETGDHWYAAELRRVHGELLWMGQAAMPDSDTVLRDAEACLVAALEESLVQGCRSLQLRAATSLGGLWHARGRSAEAAQLLQSACARISEGRDWEDYRAAMDLLETATLASVPGDVAATGPAASRSASDEAEDASGSRQQRPFEQRD